MNSEQIDKALRNDNMVNEVYVGTFPADLLHIRRNFLVLILQIPSLLACRESIGWLFTVTAMRRIVSTATGRI